MSIMDYPRWYLRAGEEICRDFELGDIDYTTYTNQMRELNEELEEYVAHMFDGD